MGISFDVGERSSQSRFDLLRIEPLFEGLHDDAGSGIQAVDEATLRIEQHGPVRVVNDVH